MPRCFSISIQSEVAARVFFLPLTCAGLGDGPAVEQELFRQGGLTGVGVGDDGEGSSSFDSRIRIVTKDRPPLGFEVL